MPHPTCDIAEQLRRVGAITVVMGLARGKGRQTAQISADEKAVIEEYDAAVFVLGNFKDCILEHKVRLFEDIDIPVVAVCGPEIEELPSCEALVCGIGRKVERMRREEVIHRMRWLRRSRGRSSAVSSMKILSSSTPPRSRIASLSWRPCSGACALPP